MRFFNTAGPVRTELHYCLPPLSRSQRGTITAHLNKYVQQGNALSVERLCAESQLSNEDQEHVIAAFDELDVDALSLVYAALEESVSYDELHLLRAVYIALAATLDRQRSATGRVSQ